MSITPGPWRWEVNKKSRGISLCGGRPKFDLTVMDFQRWGMHGAVPRFRMPNGAMERADFLSVPDPSREHHADWFQLLRHPDARLLELAPTLAEEKEKLVEVVTSLLDIINSTLALHPGWDSARMQVMRAQELLQVCAATTQISA